MEAKLGGRSHERSFYNPSELIPEDHIRAIFAKLRNQKARVAVKACFYLQLRRKEACALKWTSIDLDAGVFHGIRAKNGMSNTKTIPTDLLEELKKLPKEDEVWTFVGQHGHISDAWLNTEFREACEQVGFTKTYATKSDGTKAHCYTLKGLRATGISRICDAVGDKLFMAADIVGHRNPKTTMVYYRAKEDEKKKAIERAFE